MSLPPSVSKGGMGNSSNKAADEEALRARLAQRQGAAWGMEAPLTSEWPTRSLLCAGNCWAEFSARLDVVPEAAPAESKADGG